MPCIGVLLVNLGTPDAPTASAVRRYLAQFLSDARVVEIPALLWQPILRGAILPTRPRKSAEAYAQIWTDEGSPLAAITRRQTAALQDTLGETARVAHAMRYGAPAIGPAIDALMAAGCRRILIAPLYPQYCAATTATVVDAVTAHLATLRWQPALRFLPPYPADPAYIGALKASVTAGLAALDFVPDTLVASFHGMPERTRALGDPYHDQCRATARLLAEALGRPVEVAFQSRFGRAKWLEPATDATLARLGREGRDVAVIAPGFAADCLETLEELAIRGKAGFAAAGGRHFAYLPCLNDSAAGMTMLEALIGRELAGWL
ncbi:ferrochelatase [Sphingopyxis lindanitolerans]|uniref:Ferrochelatase n=1 Tax=Sphingopyxis lindanitolerans TaxID=2054227 RepID=A0A2S8B838_9SPHN|nr:ferrochelatase [Sphingopyxis lindanitolerans]PQM28572.1 ferrochelatase [Sphingopyxis lindanitolerans]